MTKTGDTALHIERVKVGSVVGDEHTALLGGEGELMLVADRLPGALDFVDRYGIKANAPRTGRGGRRNVLVQ